MMLRLVAASPVGLGAVAYFFALPVDSLAAAGGAFVVVAEAPVPPVVVVAFGLVAPAPVLAVLEPPPLPERLPERL
jgi:hypothetical protein